MTVVGYNVTGASFNTASGRYCCNGGNGQGGVMSKTVSIPQAVGTVATQREDLSPMGIDFVSFNTASGRYCCNSGV